MSSMQPSVNATGEVAVTLTPTEAKYIASTMRIELASQWEERWLDPVPGREDLGRARSLLDLYVEPLEQLQWGEPAGDVQLRWDREHLGTLALNLQEGGEERIADPRCTQGRGSTLRQQGLEMIRAARVLFKAIEVQTS